MGRLPADMNDLPSDEHALLRLWRELEGIISLAMERDLQATLAAVRMRSRVEAKMEQMAKAAEGTMEELSEEELRDRLGLLFAGMPDPHLRIAVDAYCARLGFVIVPVDE